MAQVKRIGKQIKKAVRKDKGKLGDLVQSIEKSNPTREQYIVVTVDFYGAPVRHFIVTPLNQEGRYNAVFNQKPRKWVKNS